LSLGQPPPGSCRKRPPPPLEPEAAPHLVHRLPSPLLVQSPAERKRKQQRLRDQGHCCEGCGVSVWGKAAGGGARAGRAAGGAPRAAGPRDRRRATGRATMLRIRWRERWRAGRLARAPRPRPDGTPRPCPGVRCCAAAAPRRARPVLLLVSSSTPGGEQDVGMRGKEASAALQVLRNSRARPAEPLRTTRPAAAAQRPRRAVPPCQACAPFLPLLSPPRSSTRGGRSTRRRGLLLHHHRKLTRSVSKLAL